jgi:hypothetical protein
MTITGVAHVHSRYSYDGKLTLLQLRDLLVSEGHSFCFMSEHTDALTKEEAIQFVQECKALTTSSFVFIPGFEVPYQNAHILMFGSSVFLGQHADAAMLKNWSEHTALTVLAHPVRNHFKVDSVMEEVLDGIEIWNAQYDGKMTPRTRSVSLFETLRLKNQNLLALGGLDFHRQEHLGAPALSLEVPALTELAIVDALKAGAYTFGSGTQKISSYGLWKGKGSITQSIVSHSSTITIATGKCVNGALARFGLRLPKVIAETIRKKL